MYEFLGLQEEKHFDMGFVGKVALVECKGKLLLGLGGGPGAGRIFG